MRDGKNSEVEGIAFDGSYSSIAFDRLTDHEVLGLVLYEIEKKYHFSGDGIWAKQDGKLESHAS